MVDPRTDSKTGPRRLWLWPIAILLGFPIGGLLADLIVDGVDSLPAALIGGLVTGVVVGAVEWLVLRRWVSWLWIAATSLGTAAGLIVGAAVVSYGTGRGDLLLMGAITGIGVGVAQTLVFVRHQVGGAWWWALANPPAWALGWLVSSYVITANIDERFTNFGASGAVVFGLLTWLLLIGLLREPDPVATR